MCTSDTRWVANPTFRREIAAAAGTRSSMWSTKQSHTTSSFHARAKCGNDLTADESSPTSCSTNSVETFSAVSSWRDDARRTSAPITRTTPRATGSELTTAHCVRTRCTSAASVGQCTTSGAESPNGGRGHIEPSRSIRRLAGTFSSTASDASNAAAASESAPFAEPPPAESIATPESRSLTELGEFRSRTSVSRLGERNGFTPPHRRPESDSDSDTFGICGSGSMPSGFTSDEIARSIITSSEDSTTRGNVSGDTVHSVSSTSALASAIAGVTLSISRKSSMYPAIPSRCACCQPGNGSNSLFCCRCGGLPGAPGFALAATFAFSACLPSQNVAAPSRIARNARRPVTVSCWTSKMRSEVGICSAFTFCGGLSTFRKLSSIRRKCTSPSRRTKAAASPGVGVSLDRNARFIRGLSANRFTSIISCSIVVRYCGCPTKWRCISSRISATGRVSGLCSARLRIAHDQLPCTERILPKSDPGASHSASRIR
eukprot:comp21613_c0_seq1/m.47651 comp21613_c0_seq1/g.47651  ORF comp21613_c0_seq1/g.47651 comp21613_c0_seq1/m.47651 type:complete len:489 (-) comp21613_c0_seq1:322-1788(-)